MARRKRHSPSAYKTPIYTDELGRILCRYCKRLVNPPRKTFCSDQCVFEWKVRTNATFARKMVLVRDKGRCCICGVDTLKLARQLLLMDKAARDMQKTALGIPLHRKTLWDMDHIIAVEDGGGSCGLENLRTLCWKCHQARTSQQLQSRLKKKK